MRPVETQNFEHQYFNFVELTLINNTGAAMQVAPVLLMALRKIPPDPVAGEAG